MSNSVDADPLCIWVPELFSAIVGRLVESECRSQTIRLDRELLESERHMVFQAVMASLIEQLVPAGNA